ncbi:MAG TPA: YihY/virulence factor BrkB family protein [Pseudonocardiaceae bacterium]
MPVAVLYKFIDDQGYYLAALLTYYAAVSLFPLLLLLVTGLGFALQHNPGLQQQVLHSAVIDVPVIGQQLATNVHSLHGTVAGVAIGAVGALWGGLSVAGAAQTVMNKLWAIPRVRRPNIGAFYARSLLLLVVLGIGVLLTTGLTALTTLEADIGGDRAPLVRIGATILAAAVNMLLFLLGFRVLTAREFTLRQLRAGVVAAALTWQGLQEIGAYLVDHELRGASATYGLFGIVLGLLTWLYLAMTAIILCAEINTVLVLRLWPRSLLTPFTTSARLTAADHRAYTAYATTEQHAEQERIRVRFLRRAPSQADTQDPSSDPK